MKYNFAECAEETYSVSILRDKTTGVPVSEDWKNPEGKDHRIGAPAQIGRDPVTGDVISERWFMNGLEHRVGGPSYTFRDLKTGIIVEEEWRERGKAHRTDGPAFIKRDADTGRITSTASYIEGRHVPSRSSVHRRHREMLSVPVGQGLK